jgi:tRNA dimethylallyltransferase
VYFLTGKPLTDHFAATVSPLAGYRTVAVGLSPAMSLIHERVAKRVDAQFDQGLMDEIRGLLARGVPETARPFGGLVYRQALEHLHGVRNEADTRDLITRENRHYARRQLIWFRKEPNLSWLDGPGESPETLAAASRLISQRLDEISR